MVDLFDYSEDFKLKFEKEKKRIKKVSNFGEISHIGSTAIVGIKGKGMIDILIVIKDCEKKFEVIDSLKTLGYLHVHKEENGRTFLSQKAKTKMGDFHIYSIT